MTRGIVGFLTAAFLTYLVAGTGSLTRRNEYRPGYVRGSAWVERGDRIQDRDDDDDFDRENIRVVFVRRGGPYRRPPGWDRGRKVGWGYCDVPPGLAKKQGCGSFVLIAPQRQEFRPEIIFRPTY